MVVGIRFAADAPVRTVLQAVLPIFPTADVDFLVREYWVCTFGNGLPERRFTAQEMRRALDALTPDEHAELFTIYALPHQCARYAAEQLRGLLRPRVYNGVSCV